MATAIRVPTSAECRDLLGVPWVIGGRDPRAAIDCYGLVLEVYRRAGGPQPPTLWAAQTWDEAPALCADMADAFARAWEQIAGPEPLAVVSLPSPWFAHGGHVGVVLGDGVVAHALKGTGVVFHPIPRIAPKALAWYRLRGAA